jgi:hypothetical protein
VLGNHSLVSLLPCVFLSRVAPIRKTQSPHDRQKQLLRSKRSIPGMDSIPFIPTPKQAPLKTWRRRATKKTTTSKWSRGRTPASPAAHDRHHHHPGFQRFASSRFSAEASNKTFTWTSNESSPASTLLPPILLPVTVLRQKRTRSHLSNFHPVTTTSQKIFYRTRESSPASDWLCCHWLSGADQLCWYWLSSDRKNRSHLSNFHPMTLNPKP